jgi:hypothetical protein
MYHFLLPGARCVFLRFVSDEGYGARFRKAVYGEDELRLRLPLAAEEMIGGGETRECGALDLRFSKGIPGEEEGRLLRGYEAGPWMGLRNPATAPAGEGGFDNPGGEVGG